MPPDTFQRAALRFPNRCQSSTSGFLAMPPVPPTLSAPGGRAVSPAHAVAWPGSHIASPAGPGFHPFDAFRSPLGIGGSARPPTHDGLYDHDWLNLTVVMGENRKSIG
jgi:hypothetical protein